MYICVFLNFLSGQFCLSYNHFELRNVSLQIWCPELILHLFSNYFAVWHVFLLQYEIVYVILDIWFGLFYEGTVIFFFCLVFIFAMRVSETKLNSFEVLLDNLLWYKIVQVLLYLYLRLRLFLYACMCRWMGEISFYMTMASPLFLKQFHFKMKKNTRPCFKAM